MGDVHWNPGNMDPAIGGKIVEAVDEAYERAPAGSVAKFNIGQNLDYYEATERRMRRDYQYRTWWDPPVNPPGLASQSVNLTRADSSSVLLNVTNACSGTKCIQMLSDSTMAGGLSNGSLNSI